MDQITYADARAGLKGTVFVYLAGKRVGTIFRKPEGGYEYKPKGSSHLKGDKYPSLDACKRSLECMADESPSR